MTSSRTNKPWGYEDLWAKTDKYVGKLIHIKNGESLSLQYHNNKEETVRVVKGRLYVEFQRINDGGQKVHEYYVLRVNLCTSRQGKFIGFMRKPDPLISSR